MAKRTLAELLDEALVPKEEQPYEVPENWVWVKLLEGGAECLDTFRKPINATERTKRLGDIPYYGATGQVGWIDDYLTDEELVLIGEDGAPFYDLLKNKAYLIKGKAWVNNHAHILKSFYGHYGNINLLFYLNKFNYHGYVNGTTRLKLTQGKLKEIPFPIAPITEQQRIAIRIESLFSKLDKAKELIEEAREGFENRKAAILAKAFRGELTKKWHEENQEVESADVLLEKIKEENLDGKKKKESLNEKINETPYDLPEKWKWVKLEDIGTLERGKSKHRPRNDSRLFGGPYPFIQTGDIARSGGEIFHHSQTLSEFGFQQSKLFPIGTVCITIAANIGDTAILTYDCCFPDSVVGFKPREITISEYINYYFNTMKNDLEHYAPATAQKNINLAILSGFPIPLPPIEEQKEIVRILDKLLDDEAKIDELTQLEEQIELLKKSILAKAFRGELVTNDPSEESAIELLKEVLKERVK